MSGSPGAATAFDYIQSELKGLGALSMEVREFPVAVPVNGKTELVAQLPDGQQKTVRLYALWPNLGRTCQTPPRSESCRLGGTRGKTRKSSPQEMFNNTKVKT